MAGDVQRGRVGRPRKHVGGWDSANRRICIGNDTFVAWRKKRDEMNIANDDALARYLLSLAEQPELSHHDEHSLEHSMPCDNIPGLSLPPVFSSTPIVRRGDFPSVNEARQARFLKL